MNAQQAEVIPNEPNPPRMADLLSFYPPRMVPEQSNAGSNLVPTLRILHSTGEEPDWFYHHAQFRDWMTGDSTKRIVICRYKRSNSALDQVERVLECGESRIHQVVLQPEA